MQGYLSLSFTLFFFEVMAYVSQDGLELSEDDLELLILWLSAGILVMHH